MRRDFSGGHALPFRRACAAQLRADDMGIFSKHWEDGVVPAVGVKSSRFQKLVYGTQRDAMPRSSSAVRIKSLRAWLSAIVLFKDAVVANRHFGEYANKSQIDNAGT
jgi:hypothetical protein